jgi:hypothetical protein
MKYAIVTIFLLASIIGIFVSNTEMEIYLVSGLCVLLIINQIFWATSISNRKLHGEFYIRRTQVTIKEKYLNLIGIIIVSVYYWFSASFSTSLFIFFITLLSLWVVNSVVYNVRKPWVLSIKGNSIYVNKESLIERKITDVTEILKSSFSDELIIKFKKNSDQISIPIYWFSKIDFAVFLNQLQKCSSGIISVSEEFKERDNFSTA